MNPIITKELEEFKKYVDHYQLFTNENYDDNMPFDYQKDYVVRFLSASLTRAINSTLDRIEKGLPEKHKVVCETHDDKIIMEYRICVNCDCAKAHKLGYSQALSAIKEAIAKERNLWNQ